MSTRIQGYVSDKNYQKMLSIIENREVQNYDGSEAKSISTVMSYLIDLGLRVHEASKIDKKRFDIDGYRKELLETELKTLQMTKGILLALNELPNFTNIDLLDKQFISNNQVKDFVRSRLNKFF